MTTTLRNSPLALALSLTTLLSTTIATASSTTPAPGQTSWEAQAHYFEVPIGTEYRVRKEIVVYHERSPLFNRESQNNCYVTSLRPLPYFGDYVIKKGETLQVFSANMTYDEVTDYRDLPHHLVLRSSSGLRIKLRCLFEAVRNTRPRVYYYAPKVQEMEISISEQLRRVGSFPGRE